MVEIPGIFLPEVNYFIFDFKFLGPSFQVLKLVKVNLEAYYFLTNNNIQPWMAQVYDDFSYGSMVQQKEHNLWNQTGLSSNPKSINQQLALTSLSPNFPTCVMEKVLHNSWNCDKN